MDFQEYVIENDYLKVTITSWGAQVKSVVRKIDGVEHIWQADSSVWGYHAPILFPPTGKVVNNTIHATGKDYSAGQHGFAGSCGNVCAWHFAYVAVNCVFLQNLSVSAGIRLFCQRPKCEISYQAVVFQDLL